MIISCNYNSTDILWVGGGGCGGGGISISLCEIIPVVGGQGLCSLTAKTELSTIRYGKFIFVISGKFNTVSAKPFSRWGKSFGTLLQVIR